MVTTKTTQTKLSDNTLAKAKRVKAARNLSCMTREEMYQKYNIPSSTLRGWETPTESRNQGLTLKGAKRFSDALRREGVKCTIEWLMEGKGIGPHFIQKRSTKAAKKPDLTNSFWQEEFAIQQEIKTFEEYNPNSIVVLCPDDGLEPHIERGDYVGGIKVSQGFEALHNKLCVIKCTNNDLYVRKFSKGKNKELYNLYCINPQTSVTKPILFDMEVEWAANIIWHRKTSI